jgi:uncharacterized protein
MPSLQKDQPGGIITIAGFSGVGFRIGPTRLPGGVIVWPEGAEEWSPPALALLAATDLAAIDKAKPPIDLLIVGSGARLARPGRALIAAMAARHVAVEAMDSRAAARTYNLLAGEGRRVAAALYPLDA